MSAIKTAPYRLASQPPKPIKLSISEPLGTPKLILEKNEKTYTIEYEGTGFLFKGNGADLMRFTNSTAELNNLVYSVTDSRISSSLSSHGVDNWKLLKSEYFDAYPTDQITRCGGVVILGGPCHTSSVFLLLTNRRSRR